MVVKAIYAVIEKLKSANKPLSIEKQKVLAGWLVEFLSQHDQKLLTQVFINIEKEARGEIAKNPRANLL